MHGLTICTGVTVYYDMSQALANGWAIADGIHTPCAMESIASMFFLAIYMFQLTTNLLFMKISQVEDRWTEHRLVCIHCDAFSMQISNMSTIFLIFEHFVSD